MAPSRLRRAAAGLLVLGAGLSALPAGAARIPDLASNTAPARMAAAPVRVRTACVRSRLLAPVCPRRLPAVESQAWDTLTCLAGTRGCLGGPAAELRLELAGARQLGA